MIYANCRRETHMSTGFWLEILKGIVRKVLVYRGEQYYKGF